MHPVLRLLRPWQWYKNVVVFLALFFSGNLFNLDLFLRTFAVFAAFCLVSSGTYVFNDILDAEEDKRHPDKKSRPIPSGAVSVRLALVLGFAVLLLGLLSLAYAGPYVLFFGIALVLNTLFYSLIFRHVAGVDIPVLALNFLFRTLAGVYAIGTPISPWIIAIPYFLALYLAVLKRYGELRRAGIRRVLKTYSAETLETLASAMVALLLALYTLYVFSKGYSTRWALTIPLASVVLFRWHALAMRDPILAEKAHKMLKDPWFVLGASLWMFALLLLIYG